MSPAPGAATADAVRTRLAEVRRRIAAAAGGRHVEILAVTKGFGPDAVDAAVEVGLVSVGENYAQELLEKAASGAGGTGVRWHFIGGIQRNKVATLAPHVALWQTVDRAAVVDAIAAHAPGASALIQLNLTADPRRPGCAWDDAAALLERARRAHLDVRGLMGVGPPDDLTAARASFARLRDLRDELGLRELSMGMTGDLEVAVAEGATMVRVGTALFGPRPRRSDLRR